MKLTLSLYFFMIAIIQFGILFGIYHYYQSQESIAPSRYWFASLLLSALALMLFGSGILIIKDIADPPFSFTVANTLFFASSVMQTLFCISLRKEIPNYIEKIFLSSIFIFILFFEYLRQTSDFETRTIAVVTFVCVAYVFQIIEIKKFRKENFSKQLIYIQYVTTIELIFALCRIIVITVNNFGIKSLEQLPQMLIMATLAQLVMNTLSYISAAGYWAEKISFLNAKNIAENEANEKKVTEISALLKEKERLIVGLLKANKTATTGALSASIAHELNQPLTASTLNIQLLKKAIAGEPIQTEACTKIVNSLENDTQRAATIVKSLRSIFTDDDATIEFIEIVEIFTNVLDVIKKELDEANIEIESNIDKRLKIRVNSTEFQQVLLNLFSNSIYALSKSDKFPKKIILSATKKESTVQIIFADNGYGIAKEYQPNLFELLSTTKQSGMGLGLWLCEHIITRQNGKIWYEDNELGAKFIIELPQAN